MNGVHVHASVLDFLVTAAYVLIFSFVWRLLAAKLSEKPLGQAMAAVF